MYDCRVHLYYKSNQQAFDEIENIIQKENIACDYQKNNSFIYTDDPNYVKDIQEQTDIFHSLRIETIHYELKQFMMKIIWLH